MPIYCFRCDTCKLELEKVQGLDEKAPSCPNCGGGLIKKTTCTADYRVGGRSARRRWCEKWSPDSEPFRFGDHRDKGQ